MTFTATEIFKALKEADCLKYDARKFQALLNKFVPDLISQYHIPTKSSVVYTWRDGTDVLYVGKSNYWHNRIAAHLVEMMAQSNEMYKHFYAAHEANTLSVTYVNTTAEELAALEIETIYASSCPTMYNFDFNPNPPRTRFKNKFTSEEIQKLINDKTPPLCNSLDEWREHYTQRTTFNNLDEWREYKKVHNRKEFDAHWSNDPVYISMKHRLRENGLNNAIGDCVHCKMTTTWKKLIKHEEKCLYQYPQEDIDVIMDGFPTKAVNAYVKDIVGSYNVSGAQIKEHKNKLDLIKKQLIIT